MGENELPANLAGWRAHRDDVLGRVRQEMNAQLRKWGQQDHDPFAYLAILVEEVGELAQAALKARFEGGAHHRMQAEALQVAAVGASLLQCLERNEWRWGSHAEEEPPGADVPEDDPNEPHRMPLTGAHMRLRILAAANRVEQHSQGDYLKEGTKVFTNLELAKLLVAADAGAERGRATEDEAQAILDWSAETMLKAGLLELVFQDKARLRLAESGKVEACLLEPQHSPGSPGTERRS